MGAIVGAVVAAVLSGALGFIETQTRLIFRPRRVSIHLWIARVLVEGLAGLFAWWLLSTFWAASWVNGPLGGVVAGASAPAILRMRFVSMGSEEKKTALGPAYVYEKITGYLEWRLDEAGAVEQTLWLSTTIEPCIPNPISWSVAKSRIGSYVEGRSQNIPEIKKMFQKKVQELELDPSSEFDRTRDLITWAVHNFDCRAIVASMTKLPPTPVVAIQVSPLKGPAGSSLSDAEPEPQAFVQEGHDQSDPD